jgi:soluble lytic murein transglycosylase-like protein
MAENTRTLKRIEVSDDNEEVAGIDWSKLSKEQKLIHNKIVDEAERQNIDPDLAVTVGWIENRFRPVGVSSAGALGPMQIMPRWASHYAGFNVTKQQLRDSIELNVMISMKMMASNFKKTKSWKQAAGKYHTGKPCIDWYAKKVVLKDYKVNWLEPDSIVNL